MCAMTWPMPMEDPACMRMSNTTLQRLATPGWMTGAAVEEPRSRSFAEHHQLEIFMPHNE